MDVTVTFNGLEYGHIETEKVSRTMAGHRIGSWLQNSGVTVTAVSTEPSSQKGTGFAIRVTKKIKD